MRLDRKTRATIERIVRHCEMFRYGAVDGAIDSSLNPVAAQYHQFAALHLIATMFLVDRGPRPIGGFVYHALESIGQIQLVDPIRLLLAERVGKVTLEKALRDYRNKLAVHGDLARTSLPADTRAIVGPGRAAERMSRLIGQLGDEIDNLERALRALLPRSSRQR